MLVLISFSCPLPVLLPSLTFSLLPFVPSSVPTFLPPFLSALLNGAYNFYLFCSQQANLLSFASNRFIAAPSLPLRGICSCILVEILRHRRANNGYAANNSNGNGNRRWREAATAATDIETNGNGNCPNSGAGDEGVMGQGARLACCKVEANKTRRICCALLSWRLGGACLL